MPLFSRHPEIGELHVAGQFFSESEDELGTVLANYPFFKRAFLSEDELLAMAAMQDYLLVLYENWDARMEAATLFVAARANTPVISYDQGWCGRMLRTYECGVIVSTGTRPGQEFFAALPERNSDAYLRMLEGLKGFRDAQGGEAARATFMSKLGLARKI